MRNRQNEPTISTVWLIVRESEKGSLEQSPETPCEDGTGTTIAQDRKCHGNERGTCGQRGGEEPDEPEQNPPGTVTETVEPQRREQRDEERCEGDGDERGCRGGRRSGDARHTTRGPSGGGEPECDGDPGEQQPPECHPLVAAPLPRRSGGTYPGPRSPRPGRADVISPRRSTIWPLTSTYVIPTEGWWGFSKVARSFTVSGSKTVISAAMPGLSNPRSASPTRWAASDVIFRTANSSGIRCCCRT